MTTQMSANARSPAWRGMTGPPIGKELDQKYAKNFSKNDYPNVCNCPRASLAREDDASHRKRLEQKYAKHLRNNDYLP